MGKKMELKKPKKLINKKKDKSQRKCLGIKNRISCGHSMMVDDLNSLVIIIIKSLD